MTPLNQAIFAAGLFVSGLCLAFLYRTFVELRRIDEESERRSDARRARDLEAATTRRER
jgi:hypothetical protein